MQLEFTVEDKGFEAALRSLDRPTARRVMKRALNDTANKARTMLADKARETYAIKKSGFKRNARLKRATGGNLAAYILVSGKANELKDFRVNPASYATGAARPAVYRAKVLQAGGLKALRKPSGGKAFMVRFSRGTSPSQSARVRPACRLRHCIRRLTRLWSALGACTVFSVRRLVRCWKSRLNVR